MKRFIRFSALTLILAATAVFSAPKEVDALTTYFYGSCSATCEPCWSGTGCPDFHGRRQTCYRYCP